MCVLVAYRDTVLTCLCFLPHTRACIAMLIENVLDGLILLLLNVCT